MLIWTSVADDLDMLRSVLDTCPDGILAFDDEGRCILSNCPAREMLGWSEEQMLARGVSDLISYDPAPIRAARWRRFLDAREEVGDTFVVRADGSNLRVDYRARTSLRARCHVVTFRDASARTRGEQMEWIGRGVARVLDSGADPEALERALALCCTGGGWEFSALWQLDEHEPILRFASGWAAPAFPAGTHLLQAALGLEIRLGERTVGGVVAADAPRWIADFESDAGSLYRAQYGRTGLRSGVVVPVRSGGRAVGALVLLGSTARPTDPVLMMGLCDAVLPFGVALARARAQRDAETSRRAAEQAQSVVQLRTAALHAERRRIAMDLHDAVGQTLSMAKLAIARAGADPGAGGLEHALDLVDAVIRQIRTMIFDLHPPMIDVLGLFPTLERYAELLTHSSGVQVLVSEFGERRDLRPAARLDLFRVVKELLTNVVKHAHATEAIVSLHWDPAEVRLTVDDDGVGVDPEAKHLSFGVGIASMRERVHVMGGALDFESRPGQGTRVLVSIPTAVPATGEAS